MLSKFIRAIVKKPKRDRYLGFLVNEKGRKKFLASLDHDLEKDIDPKVLAPSLSYEQWQSPALLFSSTGVMSTEFSSLRQAHEKAPWEGGWLAVGVTGTYGVYRPEGRVDGEVLIKLRHSR